MALSKKPYRGTRDFFPSEQRIQNYMFEVMRKTAASFGYEPYNGPLLEEVELYKAKSGEELINEQIYSFTDRGERHVAIRPEMTPTLARMVANIHREESKPIRWFSIPNLMRYEKPQKGRLREHWQLNCDVFGAPGRTGELEVIQLVTELLENFGATEEHFEVLINDRLIVDTVFNKIINANDEQSYRLYKIVDKAKKLKKDALDKTIADVGLTDDQRTSFERYLNSKTFSNVTEFLLEKGLETEAGHLKELMIELELLDLNKFLTFDPTIVRGLDYYTGLVFEVFDKNPENRRAICGGGAYANLLQIFNEDQVPGVGFGLGDVTLKDFLETHKLLPDLSSVDVDVYVTFQCEIGLQTILGLARKLRKAGLNVLTYPAPLKFKKVFSNAQKKGIGCAILIGDNELAANELQIKDLVSSEKNQTNISLDNIDQITEFIKNIKT